MPRGEQFLLLASSRQQERPEGLIRLLRSLTPAGQRHYVPLSAAPPGAAPRSNLRFSSGVRVHQNKKRPLDESACHVVSGSSCRHRADRKNARKD